MAPGWCGSVIFDLHSIDYLPFIFFKLNFGETLNKALLRYALIKKSAFNE
jgi:hypothetical protein